MFVGGVGVDCDFAVVCVRAVALKRRDGCECVRLRDESSQDAGAGRGKPRPYKGIGKAWRDR